MKKQNYTFKQKAAIYEILDEVLRGLERNKEYYIENYEETESEYSKIHAENYGIVIDMICGLEI